MLQIRRLLMSDSHISRYLRLGLLMLGWLILLEIILRLPPVKSRIERYAHEPLWYSPYVPQRMKLIRNNPDADIWFVGSSSVVLGINSATIDPLVNEQTSGKHKSLNLGLLGMHFIDYIESYLTHAFLPLGTPKVVVLGAFPEMFAFSTKAYRDNPIEYEQTRDYSGEPDRQISGWLYDHVALFRFIDTFRYIISETPAEVANDTPTGYIGVNSVVSKPDVPEWGGDTNDRLEINLILVKHLRDTLQQRGIKLVFMNMPFYDPQKTYYPGGVSNYQAYIIRLTTFMADEHIPFLDVWQALEDGTNNQLPTADFMDFAHLNVAGATAISPYIAHFLATVLEPTSSTSP
jgi:hypothetical protein